MTPLRRLPCELQDFMHDPPLGSVISTILSLRGGWFSRGERVPKLKGRGQRHFTTGYKMCDEYKGIVVIIPTRNRAALAMNAIRSVLSQKLSGVSILVSNNSTIPREISSLEQFCEGLGEPRLRYIKPQQPLPMTAHWDWILREALETFQYNHFVFLTDRMVFKVGELGKIAAISRLYPDKIISYHSDRVIDYLKPVRLEQYPWTGKLLEIKTSRLSYLYSQINLHPCLPRMLNCVVPRGVLHAIEHRFGNIFSSMSPDFSFGCRCLEIVDSFIFYDKAPILSYALYRSNGASATRGVISQDCADFINDLGAPPLFFATPIPEIRTPGNAIIHEYCIVKEESRSPRFFEISEDRYLEYLSREVEANEDQEQRAKIWSLLASHGWEDDKSSRHSTLRGRAVSLARVYLTEVREQNQSIPRTIVVLNIALFIPKRIMRGIRHIITSAFTKRSWLFLARRFGVTPPGDNRFEFATAEEAIWYANAFPRKSWKDWPWQEKLLRGLELSGPQTRG
jgi:hypothetical protein